MTRRRLALGVLAASLSLAPPTRADTAPDRHKSKDPTGVVRPEQKPGDTGRNVANAVLFVPRLAANLLFTATGTAAGLIEEEQVVPRVEDMLNPPEGEIRVFPTAFVETGSGFNVGGRLIGRAGNIATTVRAGYGGPHDVVGESRLRISQPVPLPTTLSLEALEDARSSLGYQGVGQVPVSDSRNAFVLGQAGASATYRERRERFIASLGIRPLGDVEAFFSSSLTQRHVMSPVDPSALSFGEVFAPGSVHAATGTTRVVYSEFALRLDTRRSRGIPSPGVLVEAYGGREDNVGGDNGAHFNRTGGRAAVFLPVIEAANILSPKLVLDTLSPLGSGQVPFFELPDEPDFRGFNNRRDFVSLVGSLDYRWTVMRYLAARLFVDASTVAPRVRDLGLDHVRVAGGFGFDVFSNSAQLGTLGMSMSGEGFILILNFGVAGTFGDRQHRG